MVDQKLRGEQAVELEDLLALKRAERPSAAFWDQFDRELNERMLQSLVKKENFLIRAARALSTKRSLTFAASAGCAAIFAFQIILPVSQSLSDESLGIDGSLVALSTDHILKQSISKPALIDGVRNEHRKGLHEITMGDSILFEESSYGLQSYATNDQGRTYKSDYSYDQVELAVSESADYAADALSYAPFVVSTMGEVLAF